MQKLVIRMSQVCLFFCLLSLSFQTQAATFVDLNEVKSECDVKKKMLRLVLFDIENQEYSHISYYNLDVTPPSSGIVLSPTPKRQLPLDPKFAGIKVFHDGTDGTIEVEGEHKARYITRVRDVIRGTITPRIHQNIKDTLSNFTANDQVPRFKAKFHMLKSTPGDEENKFIEKEFKNLLSDQTANSIERGVLGELATDMAMASFLCIRYPSQNRKNQGFDGIYTSFDETYLFLTESKCREESKSAELVMREDLNEPEVYRKVHALAGFFPETKEIIEGFIAKSPQNIFKIVHRIMPSGKSQYCVQRFDLFSYKMMEPKLISVGSSPGHKKLIFEALRERIDLDPISLVEGILGRSKEEIGVFLMMSSLPPAKRQNVIGLLPVSDGGEAKEEEAEDGAPMPLSPTSVGAGMSSPVTPKVVSPTAAGGVSPFVTPKSSAKKPLISAFGEMSLGEKEDKSVSATPPHGQPIGSPSVAEVIEFPAYTLPKLKRLIALINTKNPEDKMTHKRIGRPALTKFCLEQYKEQSMDNSLQKLLAAKDVPEGEGELIWNILTGNFVKFCQQCGIGPDSRKKIMAILKSM